ncbi:MAG: DHH family phosphoesterase [bacterium]
MKNGHTKSSGAAGEKLEKLREVMSGRQKPLILIYRNPDPDSLSSAWALKEIMRMNGLTATIAYTGEVGRLENEAMIKYLRVPVGPLNSDDLYAADLVALVDSQPDFYKGVDLPRCDIVIDHHPVKSPLDVPYADIRMHCLATASILTSYLEESETPVGVRLATALYYGILTDSRYRQKNSSITDKNALLFLDGKVNRTVLRRIEFSSYSLRTLNYFNIALIKLRHSRNVLYSDMGPVPTSDVCVQVADFLIRVKEANWALVSGVVGRKLVIVFRCDGHKKDAGRTAQAAFGELGSAGGHSTMGRAEIDESALPDGILLTQNEKVERFILTSLANYERGFRPILRTLSRE